MTRRTALVLAWILVGCQAQAAIGIACTRPSDCDSPLTCSLGRCRPQCADSRDCPIGARCIGGDTLAPVCTLDTENHCDAHVCPAPLMCVNDQCRTTCETATECVHGTCPTGTCIEPTNDGNASDGGSDAYAIPAPCTLSPLEPLELTSAATGSEVGIATSDVDGHGFVHVGMIEGSATSPTLSILDTVAGLSNNASGMRDPQQVDLTGSTFFAQGPISIALRDNHGDQRGRERIVDVIAAFDHRTGETSSITVGAVGTMQAGAVPFGGTGTIIVQEDAWLCSADGASGCNPMGMPSLRRGRMLVVGGAFGVETRFVQRVDMPGGALGLVLHSFADDFSGADYTTPADGYLAATEIDFGSSAGRLIAMPGPDAGTVAVWDVLSNAVPQVFMDQDARGRVAVAASDADEYVLGYAVSSGAIRLRAVACTDICRMSTRSVDATPSASTTHAMAALAEVPSGGDVVLAYVRSSAGMPDVVSLELYTRWLERRAGPIDVYTADAGAPRVVDLQIASVLDGDHVTFDLAILRGTASTATTLDLAGARADATCYP